MTTKKRTLIALGIVLGFCVILGMFYWKVIDYKVYLFVGLLTAIGAVAHLCYRKANSSPWTLWSSGRWALPLCYAAFSIVMLGWALSPFLETEAWEVTDRYIKANNFIRTSKTWEAKINGVRHFMTYTKNGKEEIIFLYIRAKGGYLGKIEIIPISEYRQEKSV